jgi:hypothetical protein
VIAIGDSLKKRGLSVWMDMDMMKGEIYRKMTEAVLQSKIICPCLTEKYEVRNCCFEFPAEKETLFGLHTLT